MSKKVNSLIFALVLFVLTFTNVFAAPEFQTSANRDQKIKTLQDQGYLHGYVDGSLKLEDKIKRSEFATVIVYALEKQDLAKELQGKSEPFTDVKKDYWANGIISVIKDGKGLNNVNIIAGYPDGTFKPENKISNAEAIKMLVCLKKSDLTKEMIDNAKWPTSWIAWAREEGIIGKNSNISEDLDFSAEALRGDVFTMFYNSFMESDKKTSENVKSPIKSIPVINVRDTRRGYRESRSYNPPFKYEEGRPWTPLTPAEPHIPLTPLEPAEPHIPLTPLEPAEPYIPLTPLEPAEPYIPLTPLTPAEPVEEVKEYTLTAGEEIEVLTSAKDNGKYNEGTEISFTVKDLPGKTAKVEKVVDRNAEDITKDADGKYSFTITADTTIKVTYEDIDYTLTVEDPENGVTNLTEAKDNGKYNEGIEISFTVEKAGKIVKVEKVVNGKAEELKATDGEYKFTIEADTTIKVTYADIKYTVTT
ncbi:S-layer homology domain-containing protein, partial [Peptoniphilus harei]|uniref:S-layer homology domain-containing protein n=1 Tax=Peptoniphilus harei TaxID=54005 RepID=UPI00290CED15